MPEEEEEQEIERLVHHAVKEALRHQEDSASSETAYAEELAEEIKRREQLERSIGELVEQNRRERERQCKK